MYLFLLHRWKSVDVEVPDAAGNSNVSRDNITHPITHLKPYTRYAYYVRTYTIAMETNGAQSKIQYFTTNPSSKFPLAYRSVISVIRVKFLTLATSMLKPRSPTNCTRNH